MLQFTVVRADTPFLNFALYTVFESHLLNTVADSFELQNDANSYAEITRVIKHWA